MRSARVVYLLISLLQFIFFLKLIEYVRGEEVQNAQNFQNLLQTERGAPLQGSENGEEAPRGLFLAPKMRKKRLQQQKNKTATAKPAVRGESVAINTQQQNLPTTLDRLEDVPQARLCPACDNNECPSGNPISAGFPIIPVLIAIATGVAWFILFLIFWLYFVRPDHKEQQGGYGYGSQEQGYGPTGDSDEDKPSIFDHFMKPHDRSFESYPQLLNFVLESVGKLTDLYNDA